jgi:hypothetical protein
MVQLFGIRIRERLLIATVQTMDQPKRGRPSDYSVEIADKICDRLAGGDSLRAICAEAGMPDRATVSRWLARYEEFRDLYWFAREWQAECLVDEILEIARDSSGDYVKSVYQTVKWRFYISVFASEKSNKQV